METTLRKLVFKMDSICSGKGGRRRLHEEFNEQASSREYYAGDQIKMNEMGRACSTYGERGVVYRFLVGNLREREDSV
jgi:hypothetical protein